MPLPTERPRRRVPLGRLSASRSCARTMRVEEHPSCGSNARPQGRGPCALPTEMGGRLRPQLGGGGLWASHGFDRFPRPRARGALVDVADSGAGGPRYLAPAAQAARPRGSGLWFVAQRAASSARNTPQAAAANKRACAARWPLRWKTSAAAALNCAGQTFLGLLSGCCGALGPNLGGRPHRLAANTSRRGREARVWSPGAPNCSRRGASAEAARPLRRRARRPRRTRWARERARAPVRLRAGPRARAGGRKRHARNQLPTALFGGLLTFRGHMV